MRIITYKIFLSLPLHNSAVNQFTIQELYLLYIYIYILGCGVNKRRRSLGKWLTLWNRENQPFLSQWAICSESTRFRPYLGVVIMTKYKFPLRKKSWDYCVGFSISLALQKGLSFCFLSLCSHHPSWASHSHMMVGFFP